MERCHDSHYLTSRETLLLLVSTTAVLLLRPDSRVVNFLLQNIFLSLVEILWICSNFQDPLGYFLRPRFPGPRTLGPYELILWLFLW